MQYTTVLNYISDKYINPLSHDNAYDIFWDMKGDSANKTNWKNELAISYFDQLSPKQKDATVDDIENICDSEDVVAVAMYKVYGQISVRLAELIFDYYEDEISADIDKRIVLKRNDFFEAMQYKRSYRECV